MPIEKAKCLQRIKETWADHSSEMSNAGTQETTYIRNLRRTLMNQALNAVPVLREKDFLALHEEGIRNAKVWRQCEHRLVEILRVIDIHKAFIYFKCQSISEYAIKYLNLPEHSARDLVTVARKSAEVPQLVRALSESTGGVTVSKLRKICPVVDSSNCEDWIALVRSSNTREIERAVHKTRRSSEISSNSQSDSLRIEITTDLFEKIKKLKRLLKAEGGQSLAETIEVAVDLALLNVKDRG